MILMRMKNTIITCGLILKLFLSSSGMEGSSAPMLATPCIRCKGTSYTLPDTLVKQYNFPLEGKCGPYFDGKSWQYCENLRRKIHFKCGACFRIHRANWRVAGEDRCAKHPINSHEEALEPLELDLLANFTGEKPSAAGPSKNKN
ncbi:hypothetical protein PGT21_034985 [Puccinia graminis f. sp. tritici]|uniref:Secreted protein n=1 Tax=Puccinia graminis f. sp. tritici TaxID=56615 RepID=A0A5B0NRY0_PUCGR|nr:hypothetical protein PGT21_034985 [Puccinia graminis f. sp. tritici]KAA1091981.1 hypothetical protein PGTUg99_005652 [Puccinia graminis f. sp. tritici]